MHFTSALLLIAAVGSVSAHPGHRHAHLHERKAVAEVGAPLEARGSGRWIKNKKPKSSPVPQAPASSSPAPAPAAPSSSTPSSGNGAFVPFCDGQSSTSKRATLYDIGYVGNTGVPGKFGCNIQKIDCAAITKYDYSATFSTTGGGQTYSCSTFNKIGPTGEVNGFWTSIFDFDVKDGETVCLAFDANTQGGVGCGPGTGSAPRTPLGQIAGMWAEFDFGSKKNLHHVTGAPQSGADVSALVAIDYKLPYIGMAITDPTGKLCSWAKSDGRNFAAYMDGMHAADGVGCKDYEKGTVKVVLGD